MDKELIVSLDRDLDRDLLISLVDGVKAAFSKAEREARRISEPERISARGQIRHWLCEEAFRAAATSCHLQNFALSTTPPGGHFSVIKTGNVLLGRANIIRRGQKLRVNKYRQVAAKRNAFLRPIQQDFFEPNVAPERGGLFALLVAFGPKAGHDQSVPDFVGIGIPTADLSEWHVLISIDDLLAMKRGDEITVVPDKAWPSLKRAAKRRND